MYNIGYIKYPSTEQQHRIWMRDVSVKTITHNTFSPANTVEECASVVFRFVPEAHKTIIVMNDENFPHSGLYSIVILFDKYRPNAIQTSLLTKNIANYYDIHLGSINLAAYAVYDKIN